MSKDQLAKGISVVTGQGTKGIVESVIKHPVTRDVTAVVVTPANTQPGSDTSIVVRPSTLRPTS